MTKTHPSQGPPRDVADHARLTGGPKVAAHRKVVAGGISQATAEIQVRRVGAHDEHVATRESVQSRQAGPKPHVGRSARRVFEVREDGIPEAESLRRKN